MDIHPNCTYLFTEDDNRSRTLEFQWLFITSYFISFKKGRLDYSRRTEGRIIGLEILGRINGGLLNYCGFIKYRLFRKDKKKMLNLILVPED